MTRLRRTLAIAALAALLLPAYAVAVPADTTAPAEADRATLLMLLNSDEVTDQERAVRLIGHYAHTDQFDDDFYRPLITPLHGVVAEGKTEPLRIMAVSALYSIGNEGAMRTLEIQNETLDASRVKRFATYALLEHRANRLAAEADEASPRK